MVITKAVLLFMDKGVPVVFQWLDEDHSTVCVYRSGAGKYFDTVPDALRYIERQYHRRISADDLKRCPLVCCPGRRNSCKERCSV